MTKERKIEREIEIAAPVEAVWKALTDAEELMRWFPLDARVTPGPGGAIWFSWGPPYEGESQIEVWDPLRRLKLKDQWRGHAELSDRPQVAMDFTLESAKGNTILRLVHSGFNSTADWDDEFEATNRGWLQELLGLKHYLEHHPGETRRAVWARVKVELTREEVWQRIMSADGLNLEGLSEGDSFDRVTSANERLQGRVLVCRPPEDLCAVLENSNDAFIRVGVERWSRPRLHSEPTLWLSTYNIANSQVMSFQANWTKLLTRLFPREFQE
jgi:uncharacterized protein YndB with AHSA1/START domain